MKTLRLVLEPADGTHLYCIACGGYRTEYAVVNGGDPQSGIHKKCIEAVHKKRGTK
jgi:hypothetical protein